MTYARPLVQVLATGAVSASCCYPMPRVTLEGPFFDKVTLGGDCVIL